jgi:hypothetical protein
MQTMNKSMAKMLKTFTHQGYSNQNAIEIPSHFG